MSEILNAKITSVSLTMADHGCLTFWVTVEGGGWGVSIGGYKIGSGYLGSDEFKVEYGDGLEAMMRIMDTVGVEKWEDLKDEYIRAEVNGLGPVKKIGHITDDKWFDIDKFFKTKVQEHKNEGS